jgi:hypothetical protein
MMNALDVAFLAACALTCAAALAFVGRYSVRTWWRTGAGWNLMCMSLCVAAIFGWLLLRPFLDIPHWVRTSLDLAITLAVCAVVLWRHVLLTRADHEAEAARALEPRTGEATQ